MSDLNKKSLTDLRGIAQSFDVPDIFSKTDIQLIQAIELKQQTLVAPKPEPIPAPMYNATLMTKPPSKVSDRDKAMELLQPFINRGLHLEFTDTDDWTMRWGKREDSGTLRMPLRVLLGCAQKIMA